MSFRARLSRKRRSWPLCPLVETPGHAGPASSSAWAIAHHIPVIAFGAGACRRPSLTDRTDESAKVLRVKRILTCTAATLRVATSGATPIRGAASGRVAAEVIVLTMHYETCRRPGDP